MLDDGAPHALALAPVLDENERRAHARLPTLGLQHPDVPDLMHGAGSGDTGVGSRVLELANASFHEPPVVVDDRRGRQWIGLIRLERNPVRRGVGVELEPIGESTKVEQGGVAKTKMRALDVKL